jgi:nitroreductase
MKDGRMSEIIRPIETRRARRALSGRSIPREMAEALLRAAHWAPSCSNSQPWRFIAVDDPGVLDRVKEHLSGGNYWAKPCPLLVAVASRRDLDCALSEGRDYFLFGCGMAIENLMIQATALGLIAHPIAGYNPTAVKEILGIPADYTLITLVIVGHPSEDLSGLSDKHRATELGPRNRRPLDEVLSWNRFSLDDPASPSDQG